MIAWQTMGVCTTGRTSAKLPPYSQLRHERSTGHQRGAAAAAGQYYQQDSGLRVTSSLVDPKPFPAASAKKLGESLLGSTSDDV